MSKQQAYLDYLGIDHYIPKNQAIASPKEQATAKPGTVTIINELGNPAIQQTVPAAPALQHTTKPRSLGTWEELQQTIKNCQKCGLCQTRTNTVFGVGNKQAKLLLIGEAPGATEDQKGEPFVGQAGQLLDRMLAAIQLDRTQVFIANILKCRPPNNRDPLPTEVSECIPYLLKQIDFIQPQLILALGRIAAQNLLNTQKSLGQLRGDTFNFGTQQIPLMVTYHPAYLLRNPADKKNAWVDLQRVQAFLKQFGEQ